MKVTIDRIENGIAVLELSDGTHIDAPARLFDGAAEGLSYEIKKTDNSAQLKKAQDLVNKLWED